MVEALVVLTVLSVLLGVIAWQLMANRRFLTHRHYQQQATWLARAGVERAAGRLLLDPSNNAGETVELLPRSQVRIDIRREPGPSPVFRVTSEARYPTDAPDGVTRTAARRFRRVMEGDKARLEVVPGNDRAGTE